MLTLSGDCASDPPLGQTARFLARERAEEIVYGLGRVAVERKHRGPLELLVRASHEDARAGLAQAIERLEAKVSLTVVPDAWPIWRPLRVDANELVRGARYVTVAGAVAHPSVVAAPAEANANALLQAAGGASERGVVLIAGGAPAGRIVDRDATAAEIGSLLLVLPADHEVVRRLRTPLSDWLLRAASACESCRICGEACPVALGPDRVIRALSSGVVAGTELASAAACTGCGLCDAVCPSRLSPRALTGDLADRLRRAGADKPVERSGGPGLDLELLTLRLGLAEYQRAPGELQFLRLGEEPTMMRLQ